MAVFGIRTEEKKEMRAYMEEVRDRLKDPNILKNPFTGGITLQEDRGQDLFIVIMDPIYPPVWMVGPILTVVPWIFTGVKLTPWMIPGALALCTALFWSPRFYYKMVKAGMKKQRIEAHTSYISASQALKNMIKIQE